VTHFDVQLRLVAVNKPTEMMKEGVSVLEDEYWPAVAYFFAGQQIDTKHWIMDRGIKGVSQRSGPTLLKNIMTNKASKGGKGISRIASY
jgi:hypothetical protein